MRSEPSWAGAAAALACLILAGCAEAPRPPSLEFLREGPLDSPEALAAWTREPCDPRPGSVPSGSLRIYPRFQDPVRDQVERLLSQLGEVKRLDNFGGPDWTSNLGAVSVDRFWGRLEPPTLVYHQSWYDREPTWTAERVEGLAQGIAQAWGIPDAVAASFNVTTDANGLGRLEYRQPAPHDGSLSIATEVRPHALADDGRELGTWYRQTIELEPFSPVNRDGWPISAAEATAIAQQTLDCLVLGNHTDGLTLEPGMVRAASSIGYLFTTPPLPDATTPPCEFNAITVDAVTGAVLQVHRNIVYRYVPGCAAALQR